jgi:hypothetical protein
MDMSSGQAEDLDYVVDVTNRVPGWPHVRVRDATVYDIRRRSIKLVQR